jgi:hypothetical protein
MTRAPQVDVVIHPAALNPGFTRRHGTIDKKYIRWNKNVCN